MVGKKEIEKAFKEAGAEFIMSYFTFGQDHLHPETLEPMKDYYVSIWGSVNDARKKMDDLFRREEIKIKDGEMVKAERGGWSMQYAEEKFDPKMYPKGEYAFINLEKKYIVS